MSERELRQQRAALVVCIDRDNDLISQHAAKIKRLEDAIDAAEAKIDAIDEQLWLQRLVDFCNTPNLFAPVL